MVATAVAVGVSVSAAIATEGYMAIEAYSGKVLVASQSETKKSAGPMTSLATAILVLDWARVSKTDIGRKVIVPPSAPLAGPNPLGLAAGDQIKLRDALYSCLLRNDAAAASTLATFIGVELEMKRGRRTSNPEGTFVKEMNVLAKSLNMRRTKFANSHGLAASGKNGTTCVSDMARLSIYAMRDTGFAYYAKQASRQVSFYPQGGSAKTVTVKNQNLLLGKLAVNGVRAAGGGLNGESLSVSSQRSPIVNELPDGRSSIRNRRLIVVVYDSNQAGARAQQLIGQGWKLYDQWEASGFNNSADGKDIIRVPVL